MSIELKKKNKHLNALISKKFKNRHRNSHKLSPHHQNKQHKTKKTVAKERNAQIRHDCDEFFCCQSHLNKNSTGDYFTLTYQYVSRIEECMKVESEWDYQIHDNETNQVCATYPLLINHQINSKKNKIENRRKNLVHQRSKRSAIRKKKKLKKLKKVLYTNVNKNEKVSVNYIYYDKCEIEILESILEEYICGLDVVKIIIQYCNFYFCKWSNVHKSQKIQIISKIDKNLSWKLNECNRYNNNISYAFCCQSQTGYNSYQTIMFDDYITMVDQQIFRYVFRFCQRKEHNYFDDEGDEPEISIGFITDKFSMDYQDSDLGGVGDDSKSMCCWFTGSLVMFFSKRRLDRGVNKFNLNNYLSNNKNNYILFELNFVQKIMKIMVDPFFNNKNNKNYCWQCDIPCRLVNKCLKKSIRIGVTLKTSNIGVGTVKV